MKIGVYCPVKNELDNIDAWYQSCQAADYICVLDTGSTDGTLEKLRSLPRVHVTQAEIIPWRFDDAFNMALYTVPGDCDICIRLDLDERLVGDWRPALESAWTPGTTRLRYPYVWNWNPNGTPGRQWYGDRIHARASYRWVGPTHEYLMCRGSEQLAWTNNVHIHQFPKAKAKNDIPLLLEFVKEYPHDSRAWAYLGREYIYKRLYKEAADTYRHYLTMQSDVVEKGQAMLYLAEAEAENRVSWLEQAQTTIPDHREPLVALSEHYYHVNDWAQCFKYATQALSITRHPMTYISTDDAWGWKPWDLAAISSWNLEKYQEALTYGQAALEHSPNDQRLQHNIKYYESMVQRLNSNTGLDK